MTKVMQSFTAKKESSLLEIISPSIEMITEEKMPSMLSLSMSNSICSNSTHDLDASAFEQSEEPIFVNYNIHPQSKLNSTFSTDECRYPQIRREDGKVLEQNGFCENHDKGNTTNFRKCMSLYDVSHIQPLELSAKSLNTISCETIHSQSLSSTTKSKDSGFQRSVSCLSFGSGRKNYDHVQSKVKAYIKNIKESEASRKKDKMSEKNESINQPTIVVDDVDIVLDRKELLLKIQELKHELEEKALYIDVQQKNYNSLLLKLAEAKTTIDKLRLERISLDYSTSFGLSNSQNSGNNKTIDFLFGEYEPGLQKQAFSQPNIYKSSIYNDQCSFDFSNNTKLHSFKPSMCSTPGKVKPQKTLNPICKIFSSSSRLDINDKPLENLHNTAKSLNNSQFQTASHYSSKNASYSGRNSKTSDDKCMMIKQPNLKQVFTNRSTGQIDLPNDDPFDKVKKWQESLPNLNLLETNSSEGEGAQQLDKNSTDYIRCTLPDFKENEINGFLSEELVAKCKISEKNDNRCHDNSASELEKATRMISDGNKHFGAAEENHKIELSRSINGLSSALLQQDNNIYLKNHRKKLCSSNSNCSESESQSNPAKSTPTPSVYSHMGSRSHSRDCSDSSSITSSDTSSDRCELSKSKQYTRHFSEIDNSSKSKIPKLIVQKSSPKFVLREPKLNAINSTFKSTVEKDGKPRTENKSVSTKNTSFDAIKTLKTESSQRKAWNSRNNTNFYVCKEFYFKKSVSLEDCFHAIEGMTQKATSIIDIALDRSNY